MNQRKMKLELGSLQRILCIILVLSELSVFLVLSLPLSDLDVISLIDPVQQFEDESEAKRVVAKSVFNVPIKEDPIISPCPQGTRRVNQDGPCVPKSSGIKLDDQFLLQAFLFNRRKTSSTTSTSSFHNNKRRRTTTTSAPPTRDVLSIPTYIIEQNNFSNNGYSESRPPPLPLTPIFEQTNRMTTPRSIYAIATIIPNTGETTTTLPTTSFINKEDTTIDSASIEPLENASSNDENSTMIQFLESEIASLSLNRNNSKEVQHHIDEGQTTRLPLIEIRIERTTESNVESTTITPEINETTLEPIIESTPITSENTEVMSELVTESTISPFEEITEIFPSEASLVTTTMAPIVDFFENTNHLKNKKETVPPFSTTNLPLVDLEEELPTEFMHDFGQIKHHEAQSVNVQSIIFQEDDQYPFMIQNPKEESLKIPIETTTEYPLFDVTTRMVRPFPRRTPSLSPIIFPTDPPKNEQSSDGYLRFPDFSEYGKFSVIPVQRSKPYLIEHRSVPRLSRFPMAFVTPDRISDHRIH